MGRVSRRDGGRMRTGHLARRVVLRERHLSPWEAALGEKVPVQTPSGTVNLTLPPNSKSGGKLRLKGRGLPAKEPGDLYVVLDIVTPPADTEQEREAYRNFRDSFRFDPRTGAS